MPGKDAEGAPNRVRAIRQGVAQGLCQDVRREPLPGGSELAMGVMETAQELCHVKLLGQGLWAGAPGKVGLPGRRHRRQAHHAHQAQARGGQMPDDPAGIVAQGVLYPPIRVHEIAHQGTQDAGVVIVELSKGDEFGQHGGSQGCVEVPGLGVWDPQTMSTTISESTSPDKMPWVAIGVPAPRWPEPSGHTGLFRMGKGPPGHFLRSDQERRLGLSGLPCQDPAFGPSAFPKQSPDAMIQRAMKFLLLSIPFLLLLSGCSRTEKSWADAKGMPRISRHRTPGTLAHPGDAADVKRAPFHPLVPTGGWNALSLLDPKRTLALSGNFLTHHENLVAGYVRFSRPSVLRIRAYDDTYGAVYGGWSPVTLRVNPSSEHQYVALGQLSAGDGGLDLVQEVVAFEDGQEGGTILWSSAHRSPTATEPPVGSADLYRASELGDRRTYNHRLATRVIADLLGRGDLAEARRVTDLSIDLWEQQPEMVDSSRHPIPNRIARRGQLAYLLLIRVGLEFGSPEADQSARRIESLVAEFRREDRFTCGFYRARLPVYRWLALPPGPSLRELPLLDATHAESDPQVTQILRFLGTAKTHSSRGNSPYELYLRTFPNDFWVGVRARLEGREAEAQAILSNHLRATSATAPESQPFELAAAAKLSCRNSTQRSTEE